MTLDEFLNEQLKDPEFKREYDAPHCIRLITIDFFLTDSLCSCIVMIQMPLAGNGNPVKRLTGFFLFAGFLPIRDF